MPNPQSELRIFISSTFHDLQEEREYLVKKVFPEIRHLCRERGVEFTEIDLRWGLTEEEATHGKIIRTCLEEIDRCRPYFIGIIGERYGWSPKFHEVQKDAELIRKYPWIEDTTADGASIIDMEFEYGVLQNPSHAYGAYFYFRKNSPNASQEPNIKKLESLKKRTRASKRPVKVFSTVHDLGEFVRADLTKLIELHWHKEAEESPLETERASHEAFASTRRRAYILNHEYLSAFNEFIENDDEQSPFVISGISGIGKSSLMAYLAHSYQRRNPDAFIVSHYIGASTSTSDHSGLLRHVCLEIKDRLNLEEEIPSTTEDLTKEFSNWLAKVQDEKLIIFIDALNQLEGNSINLGWLPSYLPPNIEIICSTTEGPSLNALHERNVKEIEVKSLNNEEREAIIVRFLGEYHKGLSGIQSRRIAADPKSSTPLYLRTLLEELRLVGNFEQINKHIDYYLSVTDLDDLFRKVLERIEGDYAPELVEMFMSLVWSSRKGLSEAELLDLLTDNSISPDKQPFTRLDLTLLLNTLDFHIIRKDGLLSFFHSYLRNAVESRYLADVEKQKAYHHKLGKYFATLPSGKRRTDEEPWQWQNAEAWKKFNTCLTDIPMLEKLLEEERLYELIGYWLKLKERFDPDEKYRNALKIFEAQTEDKERLATLYNKLGNAFQVAGHYMPSEHFLRKAIELRETLFGNENSIVAESLNDLGKLLIAKGDYAEAETLCRKANDIYLKEYGEMDARTAECLSNLATLLYSTGKYDESEFLFRKALSIRKNILGKEHRKTIQCISDLGSVLFARGSFDEAEELFKKSLELDKKIFGDEHIQVAVDLNNLANVLERRGEYHTAIKMVMSAIAINQKVLGPEHIETISGYVNLGMLQRRNNNLVESESTLKEAIQILSRSYGDEHPLIASARLTLAWLYTDQKRYNDAEILYLHVYQYREKKMGIEHPETINTLYNMGLLYKEMGDIKKAKDVLGKCIELRSRIFGMNHPITQRGVQSLLELLTISGENDEIEKIKKNML